MSEKTKGIEIVRKQTNEGLSIATRGISIKNDGQQVHLHFETQSSYVYLVLDCSGSMAGYKLEQAKKGIIDFAKDAIKKGYLVGLMQFNSEASHLCEPTQNLDFIELQLAKLFSTGSTNMADAIKMAFSRLKVINGIRAIVIATDGVPDNEQEAIKAAQLAKDAGIDIIAIGTDDADQEFLIKLASRKELGSKVSRDMFAIGIASASNLLAAPKRIAKK
jgi:Mg-chelatase subunit ChlD